MSPQLQTPLTKLLGLEIPLIQAPIGSATTVELVSEVSNAGALGMLSLTWRSADETRDMIRRIKDRTDRPFGVNFVLTVDPREKVNICLEAGVRVISFFWGDPRPYIQMIHEAGALVMHMIGSEDEAVSCHAAGVDILIAQGIEAGGHVCGRSELRTLVPRVRSAIGDGVLVAAGGISDGKSMREAMDLGADGVAMGTRFLASTEADVHELFQKRILAASASDTLYSMLFDGGWPNAPHRVLRTSFVSQWEQAGRPPAGQRLEENQIIGYREFGQAVLAYEDSFATSKTTGAIEKFPLYAGQSVEGINEIKSSSKIVSDLKIEFLNTYHS